MRIEALWWVTAALAALAVRSDATGEKARYDNHALLRVTPDSVEKVKLLHGMSDEYDFWNEPNAVGASVSVRLSPDNVDAFKSTMEQSGIGYDVIVDDIQKLINEQNVTSYTPRNIRDFDWTSYHTLDDIYAWLEHIAQQNPSTAELIVGGRTFEGRDILGVKISHGSGRRAIFVESGIHAREWIAGATATFIINDLLYNEDPEVRELATAHDWYIFPITNPDGYVWSHVGDRMWRKTRSWHRYNSTLSAQTGVDPNRNWNYYWNLNGTSANPTAQNFAGMGPFSEIETRTLSTFIRSVASDIELYLSFHSFTQVLLIPYGHSFLPIDNYWDAIKIGRRAMGALRVRYNTDYNVGNVAEAIYPASGTSVDWVKGVLGVPLGFVYEFRDRGQFGFLLPANQIRPNSLEVMDSLVSMVQEAKKLNYFQN